MFSIYYRYDLLTVILHEMDEVLGLGSDVSKTPGKSKLTFISS